MTSRIKIHHFTYLGLFATSLSILMFENLMTRIFSVTMFYHFAFMVVSIALFGMTVGAVIVYLFPKYFTQKRVKKHLVTTAVLFSITIIISFLLHIYNPLFHSDATSISLLITYIMIAIPFTFAGINICLMMTKFPGRVGILYAADLTGAALGCIFFIYVLKITDAPTAVFVVAMIASLGAFCYALDGDDQRLKRGTLITSLSLIIFISIQMIFVNNQHSLVRLKWVKGSIEQTPLIEKWNSFSRVRVFGDPDTLQTPFGWGISRTYPEDRKTNFLRMDIDNNAATVISAFDGDLDEVDYLKFDITNLVHHLRSDADVLVVGAGGGRDILSALVFGQRSVIGIEINENIIGIITHDFGDFSGNLDHIPGVSFVNDEARSYITRSDDVYDIIQVSLIDTWAATAAGAFVLTENSLYTLEAWDVFFDHLTPEGVLSFSRWYFKDMPGEMYRLTVLATKALELQGIENPRDHILIIRHTTEENGEDVPNGIGTLLVSKEPFSTQDLETIKQVTNKFLFDLILTPNYSIDENFERITSGNNLDDFITGFPLNIAPPTDDNPFFFHLLRLNNIRNYQSYDQGLMSFNMSAIFILGALLVIVFMLSFLFIITPLLLTTRRLAKSEARNTYPLSIFFACIGLGFMMIEISQLQRLTVFLGHPSYSLSVVLFSLLLSSGIGSYLTHKVGTDLISSAGVRISILLCVVSLFGFITPTIISTFSGAVTPVRISLAVLILFPMGLLMGMAFPMGMKIASTRAASLTPWFWGTNGAMSVFASVLTIVISINSGISTSFWTGFGFYGIALIAIIWLKIRTG